MKENLVPFINNLKADKRINSYDEAATKNAVILRLLSILGWNPFDIDEVRPEYSVGGKSVDYSLRIGDTNKVFLEVKRINEDLENHQEQLLSYAFQGGVKLACLTNGISWWFYLPLREGSWEERKFYNIDISQRDPDVVASKFIAYLSKENVASGQAIENAERDSKVRQKQKILRETLPKAWNIIVTEPDELLTDLINETTAKLCGHKADSEMMDQFLSKHKERFLISEEVGPTVTGKQVKKRRVSGRIQPPSGYLGKAITGFTFQNSHYSVRFWKGLLQRLSEILYEAHKNEFQKVLSFRGRTRDYFSYKRDELREPREVDNSGIFVETHWAANKIVKICHTLLSMFGYSEKDLKIQCH